VVGSRVLRAGPSAPSALGAIAFSTAPGSAKSNLFASNPWPAGASCPLKVPRVDTSAASLYQRGMKPAQTSPEADLRRRSASPSVCDSATDIYFSADVETDGPIPGPFSMLSFAIVPSGRFDGARFERPSHYDDIFYREIRPISDAFEVEALRVNGIDRERLITQGCDPAQAMTDAARWVLDRSHGGTPILVAYPLSFDWTWLYWYLTRFSKLGCPFNHSRCFDLRTAFAVKARQPVSVSGRNNLPASLLPDRAHTHDARDDAIEQAEIFANLFAWAGPDRTT